jgi:hypothetical protein
VIAAERGTGTEPPDPFDEQQPDAFLDWLKQPAFDGPPQTSRYLASIYRDRLDLQIQFPDIRGQDEARFHEWVWRDSDLKETIPLELLPVEGKGDAHVTSSLNGERPASDSAIGPVEQMLPHLEAMANVQDGSEGAFGGLRRAAQRTLFRVLRPYAFQQRQLHLQLIAALRQVTVALRRQQQLHDSLDRRVRELTKELVETRRENRSPRN